MTSEFTIAVHALVYLFHTGKLISSQELADNICTNPARVRKVMSKLHKAGLIESCTGKGSGYRALSDCKDLTLDRILSAIHEEPLVLNWHSGDMDKDCMVSSGMWDIMENIYTNLNDDCKARLSLISIGEINNELLRKKGQNEI